MQIKSHAKINLGLYITNKRDNGYHELCSIFLPLELHDALSVEKSKDFSIKVTGSESRYCPTDKSNTMYKAYLELKNFISQSGLKIDGIHIELEKNIPSQAGLGGGSSNAGAILKVLNNIYKLKLSNDELKTIGAKVGADVPFFIDETPALVEGIGEQIKPFELKRNYWILIVKPRKGLSTAEVYKRFTLSLTLKNSNVKHTGHLRSLCSQGLKETEELRGLSNDLELVSLEMLPELSTIRDYFLAQSPLVTMMSGSGSSYFAVFDSEPSPEPFKNKDWFFCATKVKRGQV